MKHNLVDTKEKSKVSTSGALASEVRKAIQIALGESGWYSKSAKGKASRRKSPTVIIKEMHKIRGTSFMNWTSDLAVIEPGVRLDPYALIFCLDLTTLDSSSLPEIHSALSQIALPFYDLHSIYGIRAVIVKTDVKEDDFSRGTSPASRAFHGPIFPFGYDKLFDFQDVKVISWNTVNSLEFVIQLLREIGREHRFEEIKGVKSVTNTVNLLTSKYPDIFLPRKSLGEEENEELYLDLLRKIKEKSDQDWTYGEIINYSLRKNGICESRIGSYLDTVEDEELAMLLRSSFEEHLAREK
jgi:hypothetical protein